MSDPKPGPDPARKFGWEPGEITIDDGQASDDRPRKDRIDPETKHRLESHLKVRLPE